MGRERGPEGANEIKIHKKEIGKREMRRIWEGIGLEVDSLRMSSANTYAAMKNGSRYCSRYFYSKCSKQFGFIASISSEKSLN